MVSRSLSSVAGTCRFGSATCHNGALVDDRDTTTDQKRDRVEDKPKKAKSDVGVGEDATMSDRVLRVEEVERNYRSLREFNRPDPGNEFVRVQVTLNNTSNPLASTRWTSNFRALQVFRENMST